MPRNNTESIAEAIASVPENEPRTILATGSYICVPMMLIRPNASLQLPHLSDPRLVRIAEIFMKNPCDSRTLAQLCRVSGASKRSIERLFQQEIGMTFGKWRQQLRLMEGMRLLAEGAKVTHAALECGYSTPSAFISMFRKVLGTTPSSYFR